MVWCRLLRETAENSSTEVHLYPCSVAAGVRATIDTGTDPIKAKIANAEQMKVHTMLVIGHRDLEAGNVSVRIHGKGNVGAKPRADFIAEALAAIKERRA